MDFSMPRDFKGVWIPKEVYLDKRLTALDKIILIEIDSLDNGDENGCFASNEYLAEFCQCSIPKVTKSISKLKQLGYVKVIRSDGRKRYLRSCIIKNIIPTNKKYEADQYNLLHSNIANNIDETVEKQQTLDTQVTNTSNSEQPSDITYKDIDELTVTELQQLKKIVLENRDSQRITYRQIQKHFNLVDKINYDTPSLCTKLIKQKQQECNIEKERVVELSSEVF